MIALWSCRAIRALVMVFVAQSVGSGSKIADDTTLGVHLGSPCRTAGGDGRASLAVVGADRSFG